jgi:hypothetical protein
MPDSYPFPPLAPTVQDLLRQLFQEKAEYALIPRGEGRDLFTKDRIISLLERGWGGRPLEECLKELSPDDPGLLGGLPGDTPLLLVEGARIRSVRLRQVREGAAGGSSPSPGVPFLPVHRAEGAPAWFEAPLPLLRWVRGEEPRLNAGAVRLLPGGEERLSLIRGLSEEQDVFSVGSGDRGKAFLLRPLGEGYYLLEDVSDDVRVAEDVAWWASVGKAFVERLERNGVRVRCCRGEEDPPGEGEILDCAWEGHPLGRIRILCPEEPDIPARTEGSSVVPDAAEGPGEKREDSGTEPPGGGKRRNAPRQKGRRAAGSQGE